MRTSILGMPVVLCPWMTTRGQVRFPRSKKRRIRKKWAKQQRNYASVPSNEILQMMGALYVHPNTWQRIKRVVDTMRQSGKTQVTTAHLLQYLEK